MSDSRKLTADYLSGQKIQMELMFRECREDPADLNKLYKLVGQIAHTIDCLLTIHIHQEQTNE